MAKGFGTPPKHAPIGYILILVPDMNIYACDDPLGDRENYGGITNSLEMAKVWRKIDFARKAVGQYIDWLSSTYYEGKKDEIEVKVAELYTDKKGELKAKTIKYLTLIKESPFLES